MVKYLLDSNIYINFHDRAYRPKFFPSFWNKLPEILNRCVIIPKIVVAENFQDEWFHEWIKRHYQRDLLNHKLYAQQWAQVLQHIEGCEYYKSEALSSDRGGRTKKLQIPGLSQLLNQRI